jgi:hypothetical protein
MQAIHNTELRQRKVANALATAASFSLEAAADSFLTLYEKIHAVTSRRMPLEDAAPFFCSQPPGSVGSGLTKTAATLCGNGFRAYVDLRTKLFGCQTARSNSNL